MSDEVTQRGRAWWSQNHSATTTSRVGNPQHGIIVLQIYIHLFLLTFFNYVIGVKYLLILLMTNFNWGIWLTTFSRVFPSNHIFSIYKVQIQNSYLRDLSPVLLGLMWSLPSNIVSWKVGLPHNIKWCMFILQHKFIHIFNHAYTPFCHK